MFWWWWHHRRFVTLPSIKWKLRLIFRIGLITTHLFHWKCQNRRRSANVNLFHQHVWTYNSIANARRGGKTRKIASKIARYCRIMKRSFYKASRLSCGWLSLWRTLLKTKSGTRLQLEPGGEVKFLLFHLFRNEFEPVFNELKLCQQTRLSFMHSWRAAKATDPWKYRFIAQLLPIRFATASH
jgi:hypothetical protein